MSFSPARAHRQKVLATFAAQPGGGKGGYVGRKAPGQLAGAPAMPEDGPVATEYQQLLAALHEDMRQLHAIELTQNKIAAKQKMLPAYLDWCKGALAIDDDDAAAPQDEIVVTCMIWALDVKNWTLALDLAAHVIGHGLEMPERFHRSAAGMVVTQVADAAIEEPGRVPSDVLTRARPYIEPQYDMLDNYRARLMRAIGEDLARQAEAFDPAAESAAAGGKPALIAAAIAAMHAAAKFDKKVGVTKKIEQLERDAKKLAEAAQQTATVSTPAAT